jgi:hypothetical protein
MHFNGGAVQAHVLDPDRQNLFLLQTGKDSIQDPSFAPTVHSGVDGMPVAKMFWQAAPFATMLDYVKQGVEQLQIGHAHIAALTRQTISDALILSLGDLHAPRECLFPLFVSISVNTP